MQPKYKVLTRFSAETRQKVAERVFNTPRQKPVGDGWTSHTYYVCEQGDCIFAALIKAEGIPLRSHAPQDSTVARKLGVSDGESMFEIALIMQTNDRGHLATPAAVRELLGLPATAVAGREEGRA